MIYDNVVKPIRGTKPLADMMKKGKPLAWFIDRLAVDKGGAFIEWIMSEAATLTVSRGAAH